jgi:cellulose 1,4-beta-cellobiosidase
VNANFYRNIDYVVSVNAAADLTGGTLGQQMRQVANYPTFIWMDTIAAVNGTGVYPHSLADHLDAALDQGANAIGIVVYDLPNRDCSVLASNGELLIAQDGMNRPEEKIHDQPATYANARILMIISRTLRT